MHSRGFKGFTLVELMITLAVVGITLVFASPSIVTFIKNYRITTQANGLLSDLQLARNNAVTQNRPVTICASNNTTSATPTCSGTNWGLGRIVFADANGDAIVDAGDTLLRVSASLSAGNTLVAANLTTAGRVQFRPSGMPAGITGGTTAAFTLCDDRTGAFGRVVNVSLTGRSGISPAGC